MTKNRFAAFGAALMVAASISAPAPAISEEESGRLLPNEEELRAFGDLAERMLREFAGEVTPMAERLRALISDLDAYESPEMLPNGDIIIRRRTDMAPKSAPTPSPRRDQAPRDDGSIAL